MVRLLLRKLLRDVRRSAVPYGICAAIVAMGFCGYSVLSITAEQLAQSRDRFYEVTAFPQVFAQVQEAPLEIQRRLEALEGVQSAQGRLQATVRVQGLGEGDCELLLTSFQPGGMNLPLLSRGTLPGDGKEELAVGDGFFAARELAAGQKIDLLIGGRPIPLTVTGSGITPENIYMVKNITDMFPVPARYDAGFVSYTTLSRLLGRQGVVNGFVMTLEPGVELEQVKADIEGVLTPYGCYQVDDRSGQLSVSMLESELDQVDKMATAIPFLFLGVAALILAITLHRLIEQQRTQAGSLMALGLTQRQIQLHYMSFGTVVGAVGGLAGSVLGNLCAGPMADFYREYFSLPPVAATISVRYLLQGLALSTGFCSLVGWLCAKGLGRLTPSEALRPAAPKAARRSLLEGIPRFAALFTVPGLMALRGIARNRKRTVLSIVGIGCAYMITASLVSMNSLLGVFCFDFLEKTQAQDIAVHFTGPVAAQDVERAVRDPAIELAEGVTQIPVTLRGAGGEKDCSLQAIPQASQLCRLFDQAGNRVYPQEEGIVLSQFLATLLQVEKGDLVEVEVAYPEKRVSRVPVTDVIAQYLGGTVYMSHQGLGRISEYRGVYTSLLLKAPLQVRSRILDRLGDSATVAGLESRQERVDGMRTMMGNFSGVMASMAMMGVAVGLAVIYTSSLVSFEEQRREISTMMMLGMGSAQCLDVISTGQWLLTLGGILVGMPLTVGVSKLLSATMATDQFSIPDFVNGPSLALSAALTLLAVFLSSRLMLGRLKKLTPVDLLRERE